MASISHYAVLDIKPDAAPDDIKKAYRAMAIKTHPDRGGMTHMFRMVQEAYETLSDPDKRAAYDIQIGLAQDPSEPEEADWDGPDSGHEAGHVVDEEDLGATAGHTPARTPRSWSRAVMIAWAVVVLAVGGYWVFQCIGLLGLTQAKGPYRMYTADGTPAVIYFILWAIGTFAASVADSLFSAVRTPVLCAAAAGAFALITATGTFPVWTLALGTGMALTLVIALPVQVLRATGR